MLARRLRLPQPPARPCRRPRDTIAHFSTGRRHENENSPSSDHPSLYGQLFSSKRTAAPRTQRPPRLASNPKRAVESFRERPSHTPQHHAQGPGHTEDATDTKKLALLSEEDELKAWLTESKGAVERRSQAKGDHGDETVVIVSSASRSLAESDFYRLAEQGKHVAGWAGGITKVVQSVSTTTREPRGQYFIFFHSRAAAEAYHDRLIDVMRHTQSADALFSSAPSEVDPPSRDGDAELGEEGEEEASAASPSPGSPSPDVPPPIDIPPLELRDPPQIMSAASLASALADAAVSDTRSSGGSEKTVPVPHRLAEHLRLGHDYVAPPGTPVLVRLVGSKITLQAMLDALQADEAERNQPWRLIDDQPPPGPDPDPGQGKPHWPRPVVPLRAGSAEIRHSELSGPEPGTNSAKVTEGLVAEEEEEYGDAAPWSEGAGGRDSPREVGYTRFVLTFEDPSDARRFARTWHKREMVDERTGRTMVVNTAVLI